MFVLRDGLGGWLAEGLPTVPVDDAALSARSPRAASLERSAAAGSGASGVFAFVPGLVDSYANRTDLPIERELTVLFADIADSTATLVGRSPEEALAVAQYFMGVVTDAALAYCGDVKDYEGDGALLYFESVLEATRAAQAIRDRLAQPMSDGTRVLARLSLDVGKIVIGIIGTPLRRSVALIGPSINLAARLLKQIPPDGIVATEAVVARLRVELPAVAERFRLIDEHLQLKGFEDQYVTAYAID